MIALPIFREGAAPSAVAPGDPSLRGPSGPAPSWHLIPGDPPLVFVVEGAQIYEISEEMRERLERGDEGAGTELRAAAALARRSLRLDEVPATGAPNAVTLNVAQACNLACGYCYADEGKFGGDARLMSEEVAFRTIDRLIDEASSPRVTVGFMGGEPFLHRRLVHRSVEHARRRAATRGIAVAFSITTNGTLIEPADVDLLRDNAFSVSVSIDGAASVNDVQRPRRGGEGGSSEQALQRITPLLRDPGAARVVARSTVTRLDLGVAERVRSLTERGFLEVGVSPARTSRDPGLALRGDDWPVLLRELIRAAEEDLARLRAGRGPRHLQLSNLGIALKEIHAGACKALPCGSALNYVSVNAKGAYYTCHRTIDDDRFALGDAGTGPSAAARRRFIEERLVDRQEPCRSCWARYLCGGGCHAEVVDHGRAGCDYIRGWLSYCIRTYDNVLSSLPSALGRAEDGAHDQQDHPA
ncbi:MAG TPA: radical SAM protein [Sorangium sp.]|nr:radical SAM protein [Sorangium sp.]